jgi:hypothetical protein
VQQLGSKASTSRTVLTAYMFLPSNIDCRTMATTHTVRCSILVSRAALCAAVVLVFQLARCFLARAAASGDTLVLEVLYDFTQDAGEAFLRCCELDLGR